MDKFKNLEVEEVFKNYPKHVHQKLMCLRQLILDTAAESKDVGVLEETLRWGEPSYLTENGSTVRMDSEEGKTRSLRLILSLQNQTGRHLQRALRQYVKI
jgi:hypothetical protein